MSLYSQLPASRVKHTFDPSDRTPVTEKVQRGVFNISNRKLPEEELVLTREVLRETAHEVRSPDIVTVDVLVSKQSPRKLSARRDYSIVTCASFKWHTCICTHLI